MFRLQCRPEASAQTYSHTAKAQDKQNVSETLGILFSQKPADKEQIEVSISLQCLKNMAVNILPAKGIGSTGITFCHGCPVDVNNMALE